jgi:DNA-directed RNA polymerase specialized sigma24 family protein
VAAGTIDVRLCEELTALAIAGDDAACRQLVQHLWPAWSVMVRQSRSMGSLARSDDGVHDVVMRLIEKIGRPKGRGLRLYPPWRERHPDKTFEDWIRIVTKNAIRDYVRAQLGPVPSSGEISPKRLLNEFAASSTFDDRGVRPPFTAEQTARELLDFAQSQLPHDQLAALKAWLLGASFEDIAAGLRGTPEQVRRVLRAGVATLRRRFAGGGPAGADEGQDEEP